MNKKRILPAGIILLSFFISCGSENRSDSASSASYNPIESKSVLSVEAMRVSRGKLVTTVLGSGIVRGAEEAWCVSQTSGIIERVYVSPGAYVNEGDPILKVDDNLAYWAMKKAEKQYETTTFENRATKNSFDNGAVTELDYKQSLTDWYSSRLTYEQALKTYENCTLRAPASGYISQMDTTLSPGNTLNPGTPVLKVVNRDRYILEISPGQGEVGLLHIDAPASIYVDLVDRSLESRGSVLDISAGSNESTGSFPVRIAWENSWEEQILPGMTARVEVETDGAMEGLIIPFDRVIEREGRLWVFLAVQEQDQDIPASETGIARVKEVALGNRLGNRVMVSEGLEEGDILILSGFSSLAPGNQVDITLLGDSGEWQ